MVSLPVTVQADDREVEVPPGLTTWTVVRGGDSRTVMDVTPTGFQLSNTEQAVFEFMPFPDMRLAEIDALTIRFAAQGALRLDVWDWQAETWTQVLVDPATAYITLQRAGACVGP